MYKKDYTLNPATCSCENGKYLASIIDDLVITCDEIIEETKTENSHKKFFYEKNAICKTKNFCILLAFLLFNIALLIAASIYCYLIKYKWKQKHLLSYYAN